MSELEGRIALVTGVGAGMGRAIAAAYIEAGAIVVGADIDATAGAAVMEQLGERASFMVGDVAKVAECEGLVANVVAAHGRIDTLVNNAGVTKSLSFFDVREADWDRIYAVNARGLFFLMQAAARAMRDHGGGGRIVNIASIAGKGYRGTSNVAYAGTKGAVIAMTRIAASQLARFAINVNSICPGVTRTALLRSGWPSGAQISRSNCAAFASSPAKSKPRSSSIPPCGRRWSVPRKARPSPRGSCAATGSRRARASCASFSRNACQRR